MIMIVRKPPQPPIQQGRSDEMIAINILVVLYCERPTIQQGRSDDKHISCMMTIVGDNRIDEMIAINILVV